MGKVKVKESEQNNNGLSNENLLDYYMGNREDM